MAYHLNIEPYKTDRSEFRITVNREAAKVLVKALEEKATVDPVHSDFAYTIQSALERWK